MGYVHVPMPKKAPELSALKVKQLSKDIGFHAVGGVAGLHLSVTSPNASSWILRVVIGDGRPDLGLGSYPEVGVADAREEARRLKRDIRNGIDPRKAKKEAAAAQRAAAAKAMTFEVAARTYFALKSVEFSNDKYRHDWISSLERHVFPDLGAVDVAEIDLPQVVNVLKPIWGQITETATRVRQRIESVLDWAAVNKVRSGENPARWNGNMEHALAKPTKVRRKVRHHPALPWQRMGVFMQDLRTRQGMGPRALEYSVLTTGRSEQVREAAWDEIDFKHKLWTIPAERMKGDLELKVPLTEPAIRLLRALPRMADSPLIFPSAKGGPLSNNTLSKLMKDMHRADVKHGGEGYWDPVQKAIATPHGTARSSFKDWCRNCATQFQDEVSELQLAHVNDDKTRVAYARDQLLALRRKLMPLWAKHCETVPRKSRR